MNEVPGYFICRELVGLRERGDEEYEIIIILYSR